MKVTIMFRNSFTGGDGWKYYPMNIEIADTCPVCGCKRGEPRPYQFCEDGEWFTVDKWENPCGHLDKYKDCYFEADKLAKQANTAIRFKSLIIYNENKLIEYIEGTSRMSAKHAIETTSLAEVKAKILEAANNAGDLLDYGIQVECMRGWDKVHVFEYKTHFKSELSVSYKGTMK